MKTYALCLVLTASILSCSMDSAGLNPPENIDAMVFKNEIVLYWDWVTGAADYKVSYGNSINYDFFLETPKRIIRIPDLDIQKTWYFAVQSKNGSAASSLSVPLVIKDGIVVSGTNAFNYLVFEAERAAWEAQKIKSYRFTAVIFTMDQGPLSFIITVFPNKDPEVISVEGMRYDQINPFLPLRGKTIDELYASIGGMTAAYSESRDWIDRIEYDEPYHYPKYYSSVMVYNTNTKEQIDGGGYLSFKITKFEELGK